MQCPGGVRENADSSCIETVTPSPAASFATRTLVRLLRQKCIVHNHRYLVLCIGMTPTSGAAMSPRVPVGLRFACRALPSLHSAAEPFPAGTEN